MLEVNGPTQIDESSILKWPSRIIVIILFLFSFLITRHSSSWILFDSSLSWNRTKYLNNKRDKTLHSATHTQLSNALHNYLSCRLLINLLSDVHHTEGLQRIKTLCLISGFSREADEKWDLLGCYAAMSGNFLQTFRDNISVTVLKNAVTLWDLKFYYIPYLSSTHFKINLLLIP